MGHTPSTAWQGHVILPQLLPWKWLTFTMAECFYCQIHRKSGKERPKSNENRAQKWEPSSLLWLVSGPFCKIPLKFCLFYDDQTLTPTPNPEFFTKDLHLQPGLEWKFLPRRSWSGQELRHCNFRNFHSLNKENNFLSEGFSFWPRFRKQNGQTWGLGVEK